MNLKIRVNNVLINYEVVGSGKPIILLHGNSENHQIFDKLIYSLKENYTVYAIDSRCHGQSEKTKDLTYDLMADDVIAFIISLKLESPILYGFSDGGIVGLKVIINKPDILSKLIVSGINTSTDALPTKFIILSKLLYFFTRNKKIKLMVKDPNISVKDLESIHIPVHILAGESDVIFKSHTEFLHQHIFGSTLEIIENENHSSYIIHSDKIFNIIKKYL